MFRWDTQHVQAMDVFERRYMLHANRLIHVGYQEATILLRTLKQLAKAVDVVDVRSRVTVDDKEKVVDHVVVFGGHGGWPAAKPDGA